MLWGIFLALFIVVAIALAKAIARRSSREVKGGPLDEMYEDYSVEYWEKNEDCFSDGYRLRVPPSYVVRVHLIPKQSDIRLIQKREDRRYHIVFYTSHGEGVKLGEILSDFRQGFNREKDAQITVQYAREGLIDFIPVLEAWRTEKEPTEKDELDDMERRINEALQ